YGGLKQEPQPRPATCAAKPTSANGNGAANHRQNGNGHGAGNNRIEDCCGDGVLESTARLIAGNGNGAADGNGGPNGNGSANGNGHAASDKPANFEEFIYKVWGAGIAKHFAIPYN